MMASSTPISKVTCFAASDDHQVSTCQFRFEKRVYDIAKLWVVQENCGVTRSFAEWLQ